MTGLTPQDSASESAPRLIESFFTLNAVRIRGDAQLRLCMDDLHAACGSPFDLNPARWLAQPKQAQLLRHYSASGAAPLVLSVGRVTLAAPALAVQYVHQIDASVALRVQRIISAIASGSSGGAWASLGEVFAAQGGTANAPGTNLLGRWPDLVDFKTFVLSICQAFGMLYEDVLGVMRCAGALTYGSARHDQPSPEHLALGHFAIEDEISSARATVYVTPAGRRWLICHCFAHLEPVEGRDLDALSGTNYER